MSKIFAEVFPKVKGDEEVERDLKNPKLKKGCLFHRREENINCGSAALGSFRSPLIIYTQIAQRSASRYYIVTIITLIIIRWKLGGNPVCEFLYVQF